MKIPFGHKSALETSLSLQPTIVPNQSLSSANFGNQWLTLFSSPHGTLGWGLRPSERDQFSVALDGADSDAPTMQIWHYRAWLLHEPRFLIFGQLTNEYIVDMFSRELNAHLNYICSNQECLCTQEQDAALMGHEELQDSENIYLPVSFLGSCCWSANQIADSLMITVIYGPPPFFMTFTCNGDWSEICSHL